MQPSLMTLPRDAWRLARPYFQSEERWSARGKLAAIIVLNLAMVGMDVVLNFCNRAFYNSLQDKDWDSFIHLLLSWQNGKGGFMPGFMGIAIVYIVVAVYRTYLNQWLQIGWRQWMTANLLQDWLADRAYYRISLQTGGNATDGTDNPDQRIAEDLRDFVGNTLGLSLDLLSNVVTLFSFITILWTLSGPVEILGVTIPGFMVWAALGYALVGTLATHLIGQKLVFLRFRQQRVEADFRFSLVRLRENLEGVALYGGEARESQGLASRFTAIRDNWLGIMQRTKLLNGLVAGYSQVSGIFPIVVAAPRFFAGTLDLGGLTQTAGAFGSVQGAMSWFITSYAELAAYRATINRLILFRDAIDAARAAYSEGVQVKRAKGLDYALDNIELRLPTGRVLLAQDKLALNHGHSTVFTGRSGTGKSTLFRALAGIWPFGSGVLEAAAGTHLFLPQRPYFPQGTLKDAVCYPAEAAKFSDQQIVEALERVGLGPLSDQIDTADVWSQRLSGGEQQRLALARALLIQPDWLFLDEATASLDSDSEAEIIAMLRDCLPNTTIVSIAHRNDVIAQHEREMKLVREGDGPARVVQAA